MPQTCSEGQYFSEGLTNRVVVQCWGREDASVVHVENKGPPEPIALFILNMHDGSRAGLAAAAGCISLA